MGDHTDEDPFAQLADLILNVSRLVRARTPTGTEVVPLTDTERQVMRVIDLYPGSAPSDIAHRTRLQRTNVSTALRSLENKGMIVRTATSGRGIAVTATERAAANLQILRSAWSHDLGAVLGDELSAVRECNRLLSRLEQRLTDNDPLSKSAALEPSAGSRDYGCAPRGAYLGEISAGIPPSRAPEHRSRAHQSAAG